MSNPGEAIQQILDRGWHCIYDPKWGAAGADWRITDKEGRLVGYFPQPSVAIATLQEFAATAVQEAWRLVLDPSGGGGGFFCKACGDLVEGDLCAACIVELADEEGRF